MHHVSKHLRFAAVSEPPTIAPYYDDPCEEIAVVENVSEDGAKAMEVLPIILKFEYN